MTLCSLPLLQQCSGNIVLPRKVGNGVAELLEFLGPMLLQFQSTLTTLVNLLRIQAL